MPVYCLQVKDEYIEALEALVLPVDEDRLEATHKNSLAAALASFDKDSFGVAGSPDLNVSPLDSASALVISIPRCKIYSWRTLIE